MIRAALAFTAVLALACACGQKGPLKLPDSKAAAGATTVPQPTPATPGPATAPPSSP
ncbi:MAG TPA: hypothetical protein VH040_18720 [Usitatibacter sp.]|nr:hypothetical protein [Usitatibacter sp.]